MKPRIFQLLNAGSTNSAIPQNTTWFRNLYEPLVDLGCDVVYEVVPPAVKLKTATRAAVELFSSQLVDKFKRLHKEKPFDLFFSYVRDGMILPNAIDEIGKLTKTANFSCNNTHQFHLVQELSPSFQYNLHSEKHATEKFRAIGATPIWWQMASNPKYFHPVQTNRDIGISFVGMNYANRANYIYSLLRAGIDTKVFGPGWKSEMGRAGKSNFAYGLKRAKLLKDVIFTKDPSERSRSSSALADFDFREKLRSQYPDNLNAPCDDEYLIRLYSESKITLGVLDVFDNHDSSAPLLKHLHLRDFEAPMSGALYLTGYCEELEDFFLPEKEVLTYRSTEELIDKAKYYMANEDAANKIRQAGLARSLQDHTYHTRYLDLFKALKI